MAKKGRRAASEERLVAIQIHENNFRATRIARVFALSHYLPLLASVSRRNARSGFRAVWRRAWAMLARPARRRMLMARLRRVAMTWDPLPVRAVERSSP